MQCTVTQYGLMLAQKNLLRDILRSREFDRTQAKEFLRTHLMATQRLLLLKDCCKLGSMIDRNAALVSSMICRVSVCKSARCNV